MTSPETLRASLAANSMSPPLELSHRTRHLCGKFNESLYKMAHEPSLAGHRVQEHVYKTVPLLAREASQIKSIKSRLDGTMFDLDYTSDFLDKLEESIRNSTQTREIVSELASTLANRQSNSLTAHSRSRLQ